MISDSMYLVKIIEYFERKQCDCKFERRELETKGSLSKEENNSEVKKL